MKYVIMADGKGSRWGNYLGVPKHLVKVNGKNLIKRTIDMLVSQDDRCRVVVTSHNTDYEFENSERYEPILNDMEIERFTEELIEDDVCFLYGDTVYTEECLRLLKTEDMGDLTFFGNNESIVAIKVKKGDVFKKHKHIIRQAELDGKLTGGKGWQIYQSYVGLDIGKKKEITEAFVDVGHAVFDVNTPEDYINHSDIFKE